MNWLAFFAEIVKALAWPVTVLIGVLLLRKPLADLIPRISEFKYKDFQIDFGKKLNELEKRADLAKLPDVKSPPEWAFESPDEWLLGDYIERLAPISPRAAISEAWRHVEQALRDSARRSGVTEPRSTVNLIRVLAERGTLPRDAVALANDLRGLRNQAVHASDFALSAAQAAEFGHLAERLIAALKVGDSQQSDPPRQNL